MEVLFQSMPTNKNNHQTLKNKSIKASFPTFQILGKSLHVEPFHTFYVREMYVTTIKLMITNK